MHAQRLAIQDLIRFPLERTVRMKRWPKEKPLKLDAFTGRRWRRREGRFREMGL
jgi:hypothetical protein